ncbi:MAG: T9SS type A sorting domain-containing protein [Bacteroidota bacterium]|nr:T9SS type A sorting domain-containing protein [Bacteroidota bacterium]
MKNLIIKSVIIILIAVSAIDKCFAEVPQYKVSLQNINPTSSNTLEFDVYLQHTNSNNSKLEYLAGQYLINFNPGIANGGELKYILIDSELPESFQPRNAAVFENQLRLSMNRISSKQNLPVISDKEYGTMIARMKLETSSKSFSSNAFELKLRTGPEAPYTKIATYIDNKIVEIKDSNINSPETISGLENISIEIPVTYGISQNFPNPFNPSTTIKFDIPQLSNVKLSIYDIAGREVSTLVNSEMQPGSYNYKWDATNFASGIYFYRIKAGAFVETKRMLLIK